MFLDLSQALAPLLSPPSSPPVFSLSSPQALISQYSPGVDADISPKVASLKGFPSLLKLLKDHSNHRSSVFKPLNSAQTEAMAEKRTSTSEFVEQHLSMGIDLQSLATTLIFSETTSVSPSRLGTALCLSSLPKRSRKHHSESKVRAGTPPRCPSLTPAMFYLPPYLTLRRHPSWDDFCCSFQTAENTGEQAKEGGCPCFMAWTNRGGEDKNLLSRLLSSTP